MCNRCCLTMLGVWKRVVGGWWQILRLHQECSGIWYRRNWLQRVSVLLQFWYLPHCVVGDMNSLQGRMLMEVTIKGLRAQGRGSHLGKYRWEKCIATWRMSNCVTSQWLLVRGQKAWTVVVVGSFQRKVGQEAVQGELDQWRCGRSVKHHHYRHRNTTKKTRNNVI